MEKQMTQSESLNIITEMIAQAKKNYSSRGSFYFLLWGWVIALANLGHNILINYSEFKHPEAIWFLTIPAGIAAGIYGGMQKQKAQVTTQIDRMYSQIWIAAGVGILFSLVFMRQLNGFHGALILLVSGGGTYLSGQLMKFKPLIFGGIVLWLGSIVSMFMTVEDQMLVASLTIVLGYLVPGYLLKRSEK